MTWEGEGREERAMRALIKPRLYVPRLRSQCLRQNANMSADAHDQVHVQNMSDGKHYAFVGRLPERSPSARLHVQSCN
eukprot:6791583-Pyramimonas_sp.AAC.1